MKYVVELIGGNAGNGYTIESKSRDAKKHCYNLCAEFCNVYTKSGKQVSAARRWYDGKITNVTF